MTEKGTYLLGVFWPVCLKCNQIQRRKHQCEQVEE